MKQKHLKYVRIAVAAVMFVLFIVVGIGVRQLNAVLVTQFGPGLMSLTSVFFVDTLAAVVLIAVVTLLFGRIYCSILCPLGILQDGIAFLTHWNRKKWKWSRYRFLDTRPVKYGVFLFVLILGAGGMMLPLIALLPSSNFFTIVSNVFLRIFSAVDPETVNEFGSVEHAARETGALFAVNPPAAAFFFSLGIFLIVAAMAAWRGRIYCNTLCPVGAVLSLIGRKPLYRIALSQEMCVSCSMCEAACKGGAIDSKKKSVLAENCVMCFNCIGACKRGGVTIRRWRKHPSPGIAEKGTASLSRRRFIGAAGGAVAGAGAYLLVRRLENSMPHPSAKPAMPPGAGNAERFHAKCVGCGVCIRECEGRVLVPSIAQYGLAGFMQPVLDYSRGSCVYDCNRCSNVCPAGALLPLALEKKQRTRIGMATVNSDACVGCGKCAEACPAKAIEMTVGANGRKAVVNFEFCIGCGACRNVCPVKPEKGGPAVTVAGVSEQILVAKAPEVKKTEAERDPKPEESAENGETQAKPEETAEPAQEQPSEPAKRIAVPDLAACYGCGLCAEECPVQAITMVDGLPKVNADACVGCGICAENCPAEAIEIRGG